MLRGRDGAMLLATVGEGAVSYRSGATARVIAPRDVLGASFIISLAQMPDGQIWFGTRDAGLLRVDGSRAMRITEGLRNPKINCLLAGNEGDLWIGTDRGVTRWKAGEITVQESRKGWALYRRWPWFTTTIRTSGSPRVQAGSSESTVAVWPRLQPTTGPSPGVLPPSSKIATGISGLERRPGSSAGATARLRRTRRLKGCLPEVSARSTSTPHNAFGSRQPAVACTCCTTGRSSASASTGWMMTWSIRLPAQVLRCGSAGSAAD